MKNQITGEEMVCVEDRRHARLLDQSLAEKLFSEGLLGRIELAERKDETIYWAVVKWSRFCDRLEEMAKS